MKVAIVFLVFLLPVVSFALPGATSAPSPDEHIRLPKSQKPTPIPLTALPDALTAGTYQQAIDHFGQLAGQTFSQRYWTDSEYASQADDAPIIFHICGEGDAERGYFLNDAAIDWAQTLGAHLVYLEHRYYGQSLPFSDLSTDHLQYLTLENAIEDLASFQTWIAALQGWKGKWISVGGSYSGTLSAIYRQEHPELVVGALASSAPMTAGVGQTVDDDGDQYSSTDPSDDSGARQWIYQACTSLGFWEADGPDPDSTLEIPSPSLCQELFGNVALVDSNAFNQKYDTPFITSSDSAPSNVLFTYGSDDVWTNIGLAQQTNTNSKITILTINGAGHHFDLNAPDSSDSSDVVNARATFVTLAQDWLK
jgi:pimeloyl-ACP methyl ester carboxylesterase